MMEPEIAFADLNDDMDLAEDMMKYVMPLCHGAPARRRWQFFNQFIDKGLIDRLHAYRRTPTLPA